MRWPIQIQLLLPTLSVVVLAIVLASGTTAYLGSVRAQKQQEDNFHRVVTTLTEATFPLTERVLRQMSGLSGAEFVLLDDSSRVQCSTLPLAAEQLRSLVGLPGERRMPRLTSGTPVALDGRAYLASRLPVDRRGRLPSGSLIMLYPEDRWSEATRRAAYPALLSGAVAVVAVVLVTTLLARRFVRPIGQLGRQTATIAAGHFDPVAVPPRNDEIRDLALSINQMTERLGRYEEEVRRSERLRTLGQLGAGMAHQLRNSATGARMAVELHQQECSRGESDESLQVALQQLKLMESYVRRFLSWGRGESGPREQVPIGPLVEDVLQLVRPACSHARIELCHRPCPESLEVLGDPEGLRQLLVNLILNAVEAATRQGETAARVVVEVARGGTERLVVRVGDTGPGPAAAVQDRLFEPFVTDKPDGTGLGLFVARQIADAHGGELRWRRDGGMTWFEFETPLAG